MPASLLRIGSLETRGLLRRRLVAGDQGELLAQPGGFLAVSQSIEHIREGPVRREQLLAEPLW